MTREDIISMAQEAQMPFYWRTGEITYIDKLERFADLVASAERERIKQANAPEIERINAYIKEALAQPEQDGECKFCTDGCPACDARKLPTQEPVACVEYIPCCTDKSCSKCKATTPPQRTWVGLTDEDISEIVRGTHNTGSFVRAIEAKLRSKNESKN